MKYHGEFDPGATYHPGDIVRTPSGYRVLSHRGEWLEVAAPADRSCEGPRGERGERGERGVAGVDGAPGVAGAPGQSITHLGPWKRGRVYHSGECVTLDGSSWVCIADTNARPPSKGWHLLAQAGADGADGRDGESQSVVRFRKEIVAGPQLSMTAANDFAAGQAAYATAAGLAALACANGEPQALVIGVAIAPATAGWPVQLATSGLVTCANWSWSQPGATLYLSPTTPGGLTEIYPTEVGKYVVVMGTVISPQQISLNINWKDFIGI